MISVYKPDDDLGCIIHLIKQPNYEIPARHLGAKTFPFCNFRGIVGIILTIICWSQRLSERLSRSLSSDGVPAAMKHCANFWNFRDGISIEMSCFVPKHAKNVQKLVIFLKPSNHRAKLVKYLSPIMLMMMFSYILQDFPKSCS